MPAGLEIYNQFGQLRVGIGHRLMRFLGYVIVPGGSGSGGVINDGLLTGVPFYVEQMYSNNDTSFFPGMGLYPMSIVFSGSGMYWTSTSGMPDKIIQFGVR